MKPRIATLLALLVVLFLVGQSLSQDNSNGSKLPLRIYASVWDAKANEFSTGERINFFANLTKENFDLSENDRRLEVVSVKQEDAPLSVGILIDPASVRSLHASADSERETRALIAEAEQALRTFIEKSNPDSEYFLIRLGRKPELLLESTQDVTQVLETAHSILNKDEDSGSAKLYEGMQLGFKAFTKAKNQKRLMIVISDSEDTGEDRGARNSATALFKQQNVTLFLIRTPRGNEAPDLRSRKAIQDIVDLSGGVSFNIERRYGPSGLGRAMEFIAEQLRNQYAIDFAYDGEPPKSGWHEVKATVRLTNQQQAGFKNIVVRSRKGYTL